MTQSASSPERKRLDSWKEIADYIGRDVRTAIRWERDYRLPVHRIPGGLRGAVFAIPDEVDDWLAKRAAAPQSADPVSQPETSPLPGRRISRSRIFVTFTIAAALLLAASFYLLTRPPAPALTLKFPGHSLRFTEVGIPLNHNTGGLLAVDLNHDGYPDLVIGGAPTTHLTVIYNRAGVFDKPVYFPGCAASFGPSVADFDGDGNLDIVVACHDTAEVEIWWGDGHESFSNPARIPVGKEPFTTTVADLNNDGFPDIVADSALGPPMVALLSHHDRTFTRIEVLPQPSRWPQVADFDRDGIPDLVFACASDDCSHLNFLKGHGDGTFDPPKPITTGAPAWSVVLADFTGDRVPDLATGSPLGDITFLQGDPRGGFLPPKHPMSAPGSTTPSVFYTRNKNYLIELQFYGGRIRLLDFDSNGNAIVSEEGFLPGNPRYSASADFNHDGLTDIAVLYFENGTSTVRIYYQSSS